MSAITNNIAYRENHGDTPAITASPIVLSSFSIVLHKRWRNPEPHNDNTILNNFSILVRKRWKEETPINSNTVLTDMSVGYFGWKYLSEAIASQPERKPQGSIIHHK